MLNGRIVWLLIGFLGVGGGCRDASSPAPKGSPRPDPLALLSDSSGELLEETWAVHTVRGAKVGHRHTRVFRVGDSSPPLRRIVVVDHLELRRFRQRAGQELTMVSLETEDGEIRQLAYQLDNGQDVQQVGGIVEDGQLVLNRSAEEGGEPVRFTWSDRQRGMFGIERSLRRQPLAKGERRTIEIFFPLLDRTAPVELVAQRRETTDVDGQSRVLMRVEAVDPRAEGWQLPTVYWVDEQGTAVKVQEAFLDRETVVVEPARATRPNDSVPLDLGLDLGVRIAEAIEQPSQVKYAVYRIEADGLDPEKLFPAGLAQRVLPAEQGVVLVTVRQVTPDRPSELDVKPQPPEPGDLESNALVQSDHPRIIAIAESVAGSVDDPWFAAQLLERHVHGRLNKADVSQVFGSAAQVAEQKQGDCSEHAVLLAAVCRARRIPARVAVGLVYSAPEQSFLYHMWNEVWIRDRWIPLDATLGPESVGGCHIKLRDSNLAHQTPYSMVAPVMQLIERIKIEVVSAESGEP